MRGLAAALSSLSLLGGEVMTQSVVVPNGNAAVRGNGGVNSLAAVRTFMLGIPASELAGIPRGSVLNGVSFRASSGSGAAWPPGDVTYANCDVTVGYAHPIVNWVPGFMSNFVSTPLPPAQVRTGPMVIEAGTYVRLGLPAPQPNPWGDFFWDFQKGFVYVGGDLGMLFTHPGNLTPAPPLVDMLTTNPAAGVCFYSTTQQAASGTKANFFNITRIHWGYGHGCPGTGGMVPNLVQTNDVAGGGAVTFGIANAPPGGVAFHVIGATPASVALPNGCTLLATPTIVFPVVLNANGRHALTASFPPGLSLTAHAQVFVIDPGAPGGFSASNGVTLTVSP